MCPKWGAKKLEKKKKKKYVNKDSKKCDCFYNNDSLI